MAKRRDAKAIASLQIERIDEAGLADLAAGLSELDWSVRARRVPPEFWQWLYFRNPAGEAVAVVARDARRPVGRFERIPVRVSIDGEIQTADLLQGLTLTPEFRHWTHLRRILLAAMRAETARPPLFSFGFTTAAATRLNAALGLPVLGRVAVFAALLDGAAALRGRGFPPPLSALGGPLAGALFGWRARPNAAGIEVRETGEFPAWFDDFRQCPPGPPAVFIRKDAAYLNWRYVERPGACYRRLIAWRNGQPAGFLVWRADEVLRDGYLLELAACNGDPATCGALLDVAREQMRSAGLGLVTASFPKSGAAARCLLRAGFVSWATRWKNMSMMVAPRQQGRQTELSLEAWDYSLGDWLYH